MLRLNQQRSLLTAQRPAALLMRRRRQAQAHTRICTSIHQRAFIKQSIYIAICDVAISDPPLCKLARAGTVECACLAMDSRRK